MAHAFRADFSGWDFCLHCFAFLPALLYIIGRTHWKLKIINSCGAGEIPWWGSVGRAAREPSPGTGEATAAELNHGRREGAGGFTKLKSVAHKPRNFHFWGNGVRNGLSAQPWVHSFCVVSFIACKIVERKDQSLILPQRLKKMDLHQWRKLEDLSFWQASIFPLNNHKFTKSLPVYIQHLPRVAGLRKLL